MLLSSYGLSKVISNSNNNKSTVDYTSKYIQEQQMENNEKILMNTNLDQETKNKILNQHQSSNIDVNQEFQVISLSSHPSIYLSIYLSIYVCM